VDLFINIYFSNAHLLYLQRDFFRHGLCWKNSAPTSFNGYFVNCFSEVVFDDGQPCDFDLGCGLPLGENKKLRQFPTN